MGKLIRLEVFNFKSYRGHHVLAFGDSYFTSIIGPNGSGKSNSMDAISFVLGIKSSHLRSTQLKDLVYRGRVLKSAKINADGTATDIPETNGHANGNAESDEEEGTQHASQRNDPNSAWVMAVYEDEAGAEQKWKRTITSSGQSEYRINNRSVTAKDYNAALEEENILIKARNFLVFQGDVEAIASQSSKDLTRLVEQISGSLEYKEEYEQLKLESEKASENYAFQLNQRRGMNSEIKQYQEQKKEVESYENKTKERDEAIVTHILWKLYHLQQQIEESGAEIHKHQEELKDYKRSVESSESKFDEVKREAAKVSRDCSKLEKIIKTKEREIEDKSSELVPIDEKLSISTSDQEKTRNRLDSVKKEQKSQNDNLKKLEDSLATVEKAQQRWDADWKQKASKTGKQLSDSDLQEYNSLRGEVGKKSASHQMELDKLSRQLKTEDETAKSIKSRIESFENSSTKSESKIRELSEKKTDLTTQIKQGQQDHDSKKKELNEISSERLRNAQKRDEIDEKLRDVLTKLDEADTGRRESDKEARMRETISGLKRIYTGVRGRLHELLKPKQKKYETAVGIALGRHWDSVVVDTETTAKECIQYLRDQRLGQATFIPLDSIQVKQINPNLKSVHRGARLAIDTVEFDSSIERAVSYACGTVLICDDLKIAKIVCFEKSVDSTAVTLDGTKISKGGLMTGGRGQHEKTRRWDDAEISKLRELKDKFLNDLKQLSSVTGHRRIQEEESLQSELTGINQKLDYLKQELKSTDRNISDQKNELKHIQSQIKEFSARYTKQLPKVKSLQSSLDTHQMTISKTEDKVFESFCKKHGYENVREYEEQQGSLRQELLAKELEFSSQKNRLLNQIAFDNQRISGTNDRIKGLEEIIKRKVESVKGLVKEKASIQQSMDKLKKEQDKTINQLEKLKEESSSKLEAVSNAKKELQKYERTIDETFKSIAELESQVQRDNSNRYGLLRKCRIEEIKIPLSKGSKSLSLLPLNDVGGPDADSMDVDEDENTIIADEVQDYGIDVDFDYLDEDLTEDNSTKKDDDLKKVIDNLNSELDKMAPNMKATDRLDSTEMRLKVIEQDLENARKEAKKTKDRFENVKENRLDLFNKAFNHISNQIGPVYKDLTQSPQTPLGGQAYLDTEDSEEPYLAGLKYHAMPPLKRFRDMEHLSGGEKTMAALALLFAVHSYQPSPFFVLDEVDAALDNANVGKLIGYIKRNAGPGMQFIVISLKPGFFEGSETLVGVMRDQSANSSKTLTLDLRKYQ